MPSIEELERKKEALKQGIVDEVKQRLVIEEQIADLKKRDRAGMGRFDLRKETLSAEDKQKLAEMKIKQTGLGEIIETVYAEQGVDINDSQIWRYVSKDESLPLDMRGKKDARP